MELYINGIQVDLDERLPFPLNYQISDIKDLSKRKGSTSKTITLPGTANNIKLMSGVYVVSAASSTSGSSSAFDSFDPTIKATARYYENGILQFDGICQLQNCIKVDGSWRFEVVLFQESIDIVKLLSNYKVRELGWSEYNHTLNATNQQNSWTGSIIKNGSAYNNISGTDWLGEGYYYGLIDYGYDRPGDDIFRVEDIVPQVFVKNIVDKMFEKIGVTYDSDFFDTEQFKRLLLTYEGGELPTIDSAISTANSIETDQVKDGSGNFSNQTFNLVKVTDANGNEEWQSQGSPQLTIEYSSNDSTDVDPSGLIQSHIPLEFVPQLNGLYELTYSGDLDIDLDFTVSGGSGSYAVDWERSCTIFIFKGNQVIRQESLYSEIVQTTSLTNNLSVNGSFTFELDLEPNDIIKVGFLFSNNFVFTDTGGTPTSVDAELTIAPASGTDMSLDVTLAEQQITEGQTVNVRQFLPEKMTCEQFFKGLVNMFNLIVKPSEDDPRKLEIEPLDDFYLGTQGGFGDDLTLDWTEIVDHSKEWKVTPTINFATKEYAFNFFDDKDYWNNRYSEDTNEQYGQKIIESSSEFSTGKTDQTLPFSQKPIVQIPNTDLIVPRSFQVKTDESGLATIKPKRGRASVVQIKKGDVGTLQTADWTHRSSGGDTAETEYPYVGHLDDIDNPSFDLLFNVPDYVFYTITGGQDYTTNNLYTYHEKFIRELVDRNGKLLSCHVKLDPNIINTLDFKRLIKIDGVVYRLQKIENYESGNKESTKIELIKLIEGSNVQTYAQVGGEVDPYVINELKIDGDKITESSPTKILGLNNSDKVVKSVDIGKGIASGDVIYVKDIDDLPDALSGRITLADNTTYFVVDNVDLNGDSIIGGVGTAIIGTTSDNSSITSTGLSSSSALITSNHTLTLRDITIKDVGTALNLDGSGNTMELNWLGVNFVSVNTIGVIEDFDNFIYMNGAFLDSQGLTLDGTFNTFASSNSLFQGDSTVADDLIEVPATATVNRRFRIIYSAVVSNGSTTGINVNASATIPDQSFILDTVNFSGTGTYLNGVDFDSNKSLFLNCEGIINSDEIAQYYMNNNATVTTIASTGTAVKAAGTTTAASINQKFSHSNNRATYTGTKIRFFKVVATLSVESGNNNVIGLYVAKNGTLITESEVYITTNSGGRAESGAIQALVEMSENDYIEIWVENDTSTTDITVTDLNVIVD